MTTPNNPQDSDKDLVTDLQNELREMGKQLEAAFKATIESERAKKVQADLAAGVRELSAQIRVAAENAQKDPRVQEAEERGRQALSQAKESKLVQDVEEFLVTGIGQLNLQLRKFVERLEQERASGSSTPTQHVPVEHEPATGETTRLKDE